MSAAPPSLSVEGLQDRGAARPQGTRTIVRSLDLDVAPGETVGIVGESGSGKSLTARALIGLLPPGVHAQGAVRVNGQDVLGMSERALRRVRGREISLLLQDPFTMLNPLMRVGPQIVETARERNRQRRRSGGSPRSASGSRRSSTGTRSSSPAGCSSGSRSPPPSPATRTS